MTSQAILPKAAPNQHPAYEWPLVFSALAIFLVGLCLHLWLIGYIPFPVFDEVYFPNNAAEYLQGKATWEGHPPLGKYFIMLGIAVFGKNELGCRMMNALTGALLPVLLMGLTYRLTQRWQPAVLAGLFLMLDGLFLVESRLGLINVYLVGCGLVSQLLLLVALERQGMFRTVLLCLAGLMLGATAAVKWNGLGFALMDFLLVGLVATIAIALPQHLKHFGPLAQLAKLYWWQYLLFLLLLPALMYGLVCTPHILQSHDNFAPQSAADVIPAFGKTFLDYQNYMIWWHNNSAVVGEGVDAPAHPYCSAFASWPFLLRPIGYFYAAKGQDIQALYGLGNPILWWFSTLSIGSLAIQVLWRFQPAYAVILAGYAANYLPWSIVKRCQFLYHYMAAAAFSFMALALVMDWLLRQPRLRWIAAVGLAAIGVSFVYFAPIWIGLPISPEGFHQRMWSDWLPIPGFNWL